MTTHTRYHCLVLCVLLVGLLTACTKSQTFMVQKPAGSDLVPPQSPQEVEEAADYGWFRLLPPATNQWVIEVENEMTLHLRSRWTPAEPYHIVALFSKSSSAYDKAIRTALSVLTAKGVEAEFTLLNYQNDETFGLTALDTVRQLEADLVLAMGSDTVEFVHEHFRGDDIPVVTMTAKDPVLLAQMADYEGGSGTNIAYTSLNVPLALQMAYLAEFRPNLQNIIILYATDNTSAVQTQVEPLRPLAVADGIELIDVAIEDRDRVSAELATKLPAALAQANNPNDTIIWITGSTSVFNEIATINQFNEGVPVLSVVPDVVQAGSNSALLSIGVGFESNAHLATLYAIDILRGNADVGALPVGVVSPPDIAINFKLARDNDLKIPFSFFERATFVYDGAGELVRQEGRLVIR